MFQMSSSCAIDSKPRIVKLKPIDATPESFAEFGQVVLSSYDGKGFGPDDAQLELHRGTPRSNFYNLKFLCFLNFVMIFLYLVTPL